MKNSSLTIGEITKGLLELEEKYNLLYWEISGVYIWQSVRIIIYTKIQELLNPQDSNSANNKLIDKIKIFYHRIIINSILHNTFLDFKKSDVLVFESSRKYLVDDEYIDIYTKYLCDDLTQKEIGFQKYQSSYAFDKLTKNRNGTKHLDFLLLLAKLNSTFITIKIDVENKQKIKNLERELTNLFDVEINILAIFKKELKLFKAKHSLFNALFKKKKAKEVYIVNFCDKAPLIKSAKDNNTTIIELQHGLMVKEDLIFHFPNTKEGSLAYFPDKLYIWSDNYNSSKLPISNENIILYGNKFLDDRVRHYSNIQKKKNSILVISQQTLSNEIADFILDNISNLQQYEILYKLHPSEESYWEHITSIKHLVEFNNFNIVNNELSIYELLAKSQFCIGVYSTAVIEAHFFGCKLLLLNLPGIEMMEQLLNKERVQLIEPENRLFNYL